MKRVLALAIFIASMAATPAHAAKWSEPGRWDEEGTWRLRLDNIAIDGKLDPDGPFLRVEVDVTYQKMTRDGVRRRRMFLYLRCNKHEGKFAAETRYLYADRVLSGTYPSESPFRPIDAAGPIATIFDLACRTKTV